MCLPPGTSERPDSDFLSPSKGEYSDPSSTFTIKLKVLANEFIGIGSSKKEAEKNAAINAINYLKKDFKT